MALDPDRGRTRLQIRSDWLLLVEGRDEVNLFDALMKHCFDAESEIQVIEAGGKDSFSRSLKAIRTASRARPTLRALGVVRDADEDAAGAFRSVCDHLRNARYEPPPTHGQFSGAVPSVGVYIVPDGTDPGAIETLCRRSREGDDIARCVGEYINCLTRNKAMRSGNVDKTFAHAYLAAMNNPLARVGEGARQGVWDFESPAFAELRYSFASSLHEDIERVSSVVEADRCLGERILRSTHAIEHFDGSDRTIHPKCQAPARGRVATRLARP